MDVKQAYNSWADQYDSNSNKTRDLEAISLRTSLLGFQFNNCLEIGCGTGKNTAYLVTIAKQVTAVDFSEEMLSKARQKMNSSNVQFIKADITTEWTFAKTQYDLVTFSLILEHIENLSDIFRQLSNVVSLSGIVYMGELHPFKQYTGTKARFDTADGQQIVTCFNHHISDFTQAAKHNGFEIMDITEYFDDNTKVNIPRIFTLVLRKK